MQRVALLLSSFFGGGVARIRLNLAAGFVARGFRVDLVVADSQGELAGEVPAGVRVIDLEAPRMLRGVPRLVRYLRAERPNAMLSAEDHANVVALWARRWTGYPARLTVSCHVPHSLDAARPMLSKARWTRHLVRMFYPWADAVIVVSDGMADDMVRTTGFPRAGITVLHNAVVTPDMLNDARAPVPHPWLGPGGPPVIVGVGQLSPRKSYDTLLRAFALMRAERVARLMILGSGREEERLKALAVELGIDNDVHFTGFVVNPHAYMARAQLFVHSSIWEGFGNVLAEALACGCPVVSTDCPSGPDEILENGRYGRLVPIADAQAMAGAMGATLDNPPNPSDLKKRAYDFHVDRIVPQYMSLLGLREPYDCAA